MPTIRNFEYKLQSDAAYGLGCSVQWLDGLNGEYDTAGHKYKDFEVPKQVKARTLCLSTDKQAPQVAKALEAAGFVRIGSWRSSHSGENYDVHLWYYGGAKDGKDSWSGVVSPFKPNKDIYDAIAKAEGAAKAEARFRKTEEDLAAAQAQIAELKARLSQQRLLRKPTSLLSGRGASGKLASPRSKTQRGKTVRMKRGL